MIGPAIQALGLIWTLAHYLLHHVHSPVDTRHLIFEPSVLVVVVGFMVSVICIPLALEVARATAEEVEIPAELGAPEEVMDRRAVQRWGR